MVMMDTLRTMLVDELDRMVMKGNLNEVTLDAVDKLTHAIKSIDTIVAMQGKYGHDESKREREEMTEKIEEMMSGTSDPEAKEALRNVLKVIK